MLILHSNLWCPDCPEGSIVRLRLSKAEAAARTPGIQTIETDEGYSGGKYKRPLVSSAEAAEMEFLQLCTAVAVIRRTASFLAEVGVQAAYLYLAHMLQSMPRCV